MEPRPLIRYPSFLPSSLLALSLLILAASITRTSKVVICHSPLQYPANNHCMLFFNQVPVHGHLIAAHQWTGPTCDCLSSTGRSSLFYSEVQVKARLCSRQHAKSWNVREFARLVAMTSSTTQLHASPCSYVRNAWTTGLCSETYWSRPDGGRSIQSVATCSEKRPRCLYHTFIHKHRGHGNESSDWNLQVQMDLHQWPFLWRNAILVSPLLLQWSHERGFDSSSLPLGTSVIRPKYTCFFNHVQISSNDLKCVLLQSRQRFGWLKRELWQFWALSCCQSWIPFDPPPSGFTAASRLAILEFRCLASYFVVCCCCCMISSLSLTQASWHISEKNECVQKIHVLQLVANHFSMQS